jgi:hypothetical protein
MKTNHQTTGSKPRSGDFPDWAPHVLVEMFRDKFEGKNFRSRTGSGMDDPKVMRDALYKLITDPEMESVWKSLRQPEKILASLEPHKELSELFQRQLLMDETDKLPEILFAVVYSGLMAPRHPWEGLTKDKRKKKVEKIRRLVGRLRNEIAATPLEPLSKATVALLGLSNSTLEHHDEQGSMNFYLSQLDRRAVALTRVPTPTSKTKGRKTERRHLLLRLAKFMGYYYGDGLDDEMAVIARVILDDENIDTEVVRKVLLRQ